MQYHLVREMDEVVALALDGGLPTGASPSGEAAAAQGEGRVAH
jgi:hypothetical protein